MSINHVVLRFLSLHWIHFISEEEKAKIKHMQSEILSLISLYGQRQSIRGGESRDRSCVQPLDSFCWIQLYVQVKSKRGLRSSLARMSRPEAVPGLRDWDTADVIRNPTILNLYSSPTLGRLREPLWIRMSQEPYGIPRFCTQWRFARGLSHAPWSSRDCWFWETTRLSKVNKPWFRKEKK